MDCDHPTLESPNLVELLPIYKCKNCGGSYVCACEVPWFEKYDPRRLHARLKEAVVARNVCVRCRNLPDIISAYGRSAFSRRKWRDIYKRKIELLEQNRKILDDLGARSDKEESKLKEMLWEDISSNRWNRFLRYPVSYGAPLSEISNEVLRDAVGKSNWRTARNCLLQEFEKGVSIVAGETLAQLLQFSEAHRNLYDYIEKIDREAENIVRKEAEVPLIGQGWVTETELYNLVRDLVSPCKVIQHARIPWLGRQHLDIFVPDLNLAIEYMGEQHYQPIEHYGGKEGLKKRQELDKRKVSLCEENGIYLIYVKPDDEISIASVEKMIDRYKKKIEEISKGNV